MSSAATYPCRSLTVVRPGLCTSVQDTGRPGLAHLAVPPSGMLDRGAGRRANALVGNSSGMPVLETTLDGVAVRAGAPCWVAVTGAEAPVRLDGVEVPAGAALRIQTGQLLEVGRARRGLRSYVAVDGGVDVAPVLGSRSWDSLSGLGPPPLRAGEVVALGPPGPDPAVGDPAGGDPAGGDPAVGEREAIGGPAGRGDAGGEDARGRKGLDLVAHLGPREDWFTAGALARLASGPWTVGTRSSRVALHLDGPVLERARLDELPSEPTVTGAVQVSPDGRPLVFLADHPVTVGYPVVAVVRDDDLDACAQARPGTAVRLRLAAPAWEAFATR